MKDHILYPEKKHLKETLDIMENLGITATTTIQTKSVKGYSHQIMYKANDLQHDMLMKQVSGQCDLQ